MDPKTNKPQWIQLDAAVKEAEDLLFTEYFLWEHERSEGVDISCEEYHLPKNIQRHVDYIMPGIRMLPKAGKRGLTETKKRVASPVEHPPRATPTVWPGFPQVNSTSCHNYITPSCIKSESSVALGGYETRLTASSPI